MKRNLTGLIIPTIVALFNVLLLLYPRETIGAAGDGLRMWFNTVLPSLFPFMVGINLLAGFGFVHFIGELLSPVMMPLFGVPGAGGFALLSGMTAGYPTGAKVVAQLRRDKQVTKAEAQRLISFCNNAGPLFMVGVVGVGLFKSASVGYCILASHIVSALLIGFICKRIGRGAYRPHSRYAPQSSLEMAMGSYRVFKGSNDTSIGYVFGNSIKNAMESIALVGGFIVVFRVITRVMHATGILGWLPGCAGMDAALARPLIVGIFSGILEPVSGVQQIAAIGAAQAVLVPVACGIISFGGFSVHMQALYFLRGTGVKPPLYLLAKLLHAILSAVIARCLMPVFSVKAAVDAVAMKDPLDPSYVGAGSFTRQIALSALLFAIMAAAAVLLPIIRGSLKRPCGRNPIQTRR